MSTMPLTSFLDSAGHPKVYVAGLVKRPNSMPATKAIPMRPMMPPGKINLEGGLKASPTKRPFGHVMISKYPKGMAGMDDHGFMS